MWVPVLRQILIVMKDREGTGDGVSIIERHLGAHEDVLDSKWSGLVIYYQKSTS